MKITTYIDVIKHYNLSELIEGLTSEKEVEAKVETLEKNGCEIEVLRESKFAVITKGGVSRFIKGEDFDRLISQL